MPFRAPGAEWLGDRVLYAHEMRQIQPAEIQLYRGMMKVAGIEPEQVVLPITWSQLL